MGSVYLSFLGLCVGGVYCCMSMNQVSDSFRERCIIVCWVVQSCEFLEAGFCECSYQSFIGGVE